MNQFRFNPSSDLPLRLEHINIKENHMQRRNQIMMKKVLVRPVSVNLSEEMYERIFQITQEQEISVSDFIRRALSARLKYIKVKSLPDPDVQMST